MGILENAISGVSNFWNTATFDMVKDGFFVVIDHPEVVYANPYVIAWAVVGIAFLFIEKFAFVGQLILFGGPVLAYLFMTAAVVMNDGVSAAGPFAMLLFGIFLVVGGFLMKSFVLDG